MTLSERLKAPARALFAFLGTSGFGRDSGVFAAAPLLPGLLSLLQLRGLGTLVERVGGILGGRLNLAAFHELASGIVVLARAGPAALTFIGVIGVETLV